MLVIRFQRVGRRNDPAFRMVVGERRSKPQSSGMEVLGSYHPKTKDTSLKNERILYWISQGAQISDTAYNLLVSKGVVNGKKREVVRAVKSSAPVASAGVEAPAAATDESASPEKESPEA